MSKSQPIYIYADNGKLRKTATGAKEAASFIGCSQPAISLALKNTSVVKKKFRLFRSREEAETWFGERNAVPEPVTDREILIAYFEQVGRAAAEAVAKLRKLK